MNHYLDIRLQSDPEFSAHQLFGALYAKLHRLLVRLDSGEVGVSFPDVSKDEKHLGRRLRLHGTPTSLLPLVDGSWLTGMNDHVTVDAIRPVPAATRYRCISRMQVQSNAARLRRRLMHRKGIDEAQALLQIPDSASRQTDLPFIALRSQSTRQTFPLFIRHGPVCSEPVAGRFNTYGLSQSATVPWF